MKGVAARSSIMEKSSKRGKIPQSDWPMIMARYEAGETLASIARTYDCSPPAISYVVSRSRGQRPAAPPNGSEAQLVKAMASESPKLPGVTPAAEAETPASERPKTDELAASQLVAPPQ